MHIALYLLPAIERKRQDILTCRYGFDIYPAHLSLERPESLLCLDNIYVYVVISVPKTEMNVSQTINAVIAALRL